MKFSLAMITLLAALGAAADSPPEFPAAEAWSYLTAQCEMGPRNPGSEGHASCAKWIAATLEDWGYRVERHRCRVPDPYSADTLRLVNLRAYLPERKGPVLALAAHWDTRPWAEKDPDPKRRWEPILGANDGASGVAILLVLARICAERPPARTVEFLFFDGEDYGKPGRHEHYLLGSRRFVLEHPGYRPELLILIDLVGGRQMRLPMERYSLQHAPGPMEQLYDLAADLGLGAFERRPGHMVLDDHIPFQQAGIPALDFVDLDYPEWHTHADRPEACSPGSLAQVGTLLLHYLYE